MRGYLFAIIIAFNLLSIRAVEAQESCTEAWNELSEIENDTAYVNTLLTEAQIYSHDNVACAIRFAKLAQQVADSIDYRKGKLQSAVQLVELQMQNRSYSSALHSIEMGFLLSKSDTSYWGGVFTYLLAKYHLQTNALDSAFTKIHKAIEINKIHKNTKYLFHSYHTAANIHERETDWKNAETLYNQSLQLAQKASDSSYIALVAISKGRLFAKQNKLAKALEHLNASASIYKRLNQKNGLANVYNNIAGVYTLQKQYKQAEGFYVKSLDIHKEQGSQFGIAAGYNNIADFYFRTYQDDKALDYFEKCEKLASEINATQHLRQAYYNLYVVHKTHKRFAEALAYHTKFARIKEKDFDQKKSEQIENMKTRYETRQKEQRILLLNAEVQQSKIIRRFTGAIAVLLFILLLLAAWAYWQKQRSNRVLSQKNIVIEKRDNEKAILLKELNHRVKNNLQIVSSLLNLQSARITDEEASEAVREGKLRIEAISLIHAKLYGNKYYTKIEINEYFSDLISSMIYSFGKKVDLQLDLPDVILDIDQATPLAIVVNELLTNVMKYAYLNSDVAPALTVSAREIDNKIEFVIHDNGPGFGADFSTKPNDSFGLRMIDSLARQLDGKVMYFNDNGGVRKIIFPYKKQSNAAQS